MSRLSLLVLCTVVAIAGCERRKGPPAEMKPADDWGGDPSDPHAQVAPEDDPHAGVDMNDPHAGVDMGGGGDPQGMAPPPDRAIDPNKFLKGTITLTEATQGKVPASAVVFLSAKTPAGGPPLAVDRLELGSFPMAFQLDERHQMISGTQFQGEVVLSVRVDQDSDVMTRQPGDLAGTVTATIPADGLEVKLDTVEP